MTIRTAHVLTIQVISQHSSLRDIPNFIFAGFNVRSFCRSAAIHEYFACEYLDITVNGHVHSSSQSMTSCVTKMAVTGQPYFASSFLPEPLYLLQAKMSIRPYLVPKCDIVPDLEKIVPPSMAKAVRIEVWRALRAWLQLSKVDRQPWGWWKGTSMTRPSQRPRKPDRRYACENKSSKFWTSAAAVYYYGIRTHSVYLQIFHPQIL